MNALSESTLFSIATLSNAIETLSNSSSPDVGLSNLTFSSIATLSNATFSRIDALNALSESTLFSIAMLSNAIGTLSNSSSPDVGLSNLTFSSIATLSNATFSRINALNALSESTLFSIASLSNVTFSTIDVLTESTFSAFVGLSNSTFESIAGLSNVVYLMANNSNVSNGIMSLSNEVFNMMNALSNSISYAASNSVDVITSYLSSNPYFLSSIISSNIGDSVTTSRIFLSASNSIFSSLGCTYSDPLGNGVAPSLLVDSALNISHWVTANEGIFSSGIFSPGLNLRSSTVPLSTRCGIFGSNDDSVNVFGKSVNINGVGVATLSQGSIPTSALSNLLGFIADTISAPASIPFTAVSNLNYATLGSIPSSCFGPQTIPSLAISDPNWLTDGQDVTTLWTVSSSVGIGLVNPTYPLHVNGNICATQDLIALSDAKLKTNLKKISSALEKVQSLTGYTFERIDLPSTRRFAGVIAQDVIKVLPEAVYEEDSTLAVSYPGIIAMLIEAIKELAER